MFGASIIFLKCESLPLPWDGSGWGRGWGGLSSWRGAGAPVEEATSTPTPCYQICSVYKCPIFPHPCQGLQGTPQPPHQPPSRTPRVQQPR